MVENKNTFGMRQSFQNRAGLKMIDLIRCFVDCWKRLIDWLRLMDGLHFHGWLFERKIFKLVEIIDEIILYVCKWKKPSKLN